MVAWKNADPDKDLNRSWFSWISSEWFCASFGSIPNQRVWFLKVKELDLHVTYIPAYFVFEQSDGDFS